MARVGFGGSQGCCPPLHSRACSTCSPRDTAGLWSMPFGGHPLEDALWRMPCGGCPVEHVLHTVTLPGWGHQTQPRGTCTSPTPRCCIPGLPPAAGVGQPHCQACPQGFCGISWFSFRAPWGRAGPAPPAPATCTAAEGRAVFSGSGVAFKPTLSPLQSCLGCQMGFYCLGRSCC